MPSRVAVLPIFFSAVVMLTGCPAMETDTSPGPTAPPDRPTMGTARLVLVQAPARLEANIVSSSDISVQVMEASGQPSIGREVVASIESTSQVSITAGDRATTGVDGIARFTSLAVGAIGTGSAWSDSTTLRLRFSAPGYESVVTSPITFACPSGVIPPGEPSQHLFAIRRGDCVYRARYSRKFQVTVPVTDGMAGRLLLVQSQSDGPPSTGPLLSMLQEGRDENQAILHGDPVSFLTVRARFLLGGGRWRLVNAGVNTSQVFQASTHLLQAAPVVDPANTPCDGYLTYVPMQAPVSITDALNGLDCAASDRTIGTLDRYVVVLRPGVSVNAVAEAVGGSVPGVTVFLLNSGAIAGNLVGALRVANGTVSGNTSTVTFRNPDVVDRIAEVWVHAPVPASVGAYRARFSFNP